ncbi:MAG: sigma 54-interacting transcriptional regulator [Nitrospinae bacterium]|nr:sigma 54-interacting transcriptional regulator [Nitrospinota bacterium]
MPATKPDFSGIVGESEKIKGVLSLVEKILDDDSTILILGESGTGKELVAKAIHYNSRRADKPLIPVNCGAIPEELLESELFGHEKGSFTGAIRMRMGKFELADSGTIFLDEIGDMSPALQVKMLRVLQEQEFERVGGMKSLKVDIRVIAATHRNLEKEVESNKFREDLFYRLNVIPISIPPLRERKSDIPILANHFLLKFNRIKNRNIEGFSEEAMKCLSEYHWPGNVRELENIIERTVILKGKGIVRPADLPEKVQKWDGKPHIHTEDERLVISDNAAIEDTSQPAINISESGINLNQMVEDFENKLILEALKKVEWNKAKAANLLGIKRTTLIEKLKKKGINREV